MCHFIQLIFINKHKKSFKKYIKVKIERLFVDCYIELLDEDR
jgi:hypothetical protein